ncbi:hypothetical protein BC829DRAFT_83601 [Chytridium lagenaria]|nr:hypothetical protein BC829DRAFT_83601 [Chytridium lagenaria]
MEGSTSLVTGSTPEAVNKANLFAHAAEEYAERGQYAQAVEAHFRAAEQFLLATSYTADPEAIKTLKLLYANHTRQGKDLQRRFQSRSSTASPSSPSPSNATPRQTASSISSQASPLNQSPYSDRPSSAGRVKPSMVAVPLPNTDLKSSSTRQRPTSYPSTAPQNTRTPTSSSTPTSAFSRSSSGDEVKYSLIDTTGDVRSLEDLVDRDMGMDRGIFFVGQSTTPDATTVLPKVSRGAQHPASFRMPQDAPATVDAISLDGNTGRNLYDSIEKSYFVLGEDSQEVQKDDPEDPFNKFWDAVENLVQKISLPAPLAFTTAPIFQKAGDITYEAADQRDAAPGMRLPYAFGYGANRSAARRRFESRRLEALRSEYSLPNMTETFEARTC